jgi:hypothetical protein
VDLDPATCRRLARDSDHGVLATLHRERGADLVPACFVLDDDLVAIPIDQVKPKASTDLARLRNLDQDPLATLLCEHWDPDDWSKLWWVRLSLARSGEDAATVRRCEGLLRAKYRQYAAADFAAILTFRVSAIRGWAASADAMADAANGSGG